jgi:hypothetical protein
MANFTREELHTHRQSHTKFNSWWMNDARGIPLCRICDVCERAAIDSYPPEVMGLRGRYEDIVEEQVDDDY